MIRSTTDEMLAARFDLYPWRVEVIDRTDAERIAARDGERLADPSWVTFWDVETERLIFDPRPEYIPPRDQWHPFDQMRPEPNPILVQFRDDLNTARDPDRDSDVIADWINACDGDASGLSVAFPNGTPEQIEDARKVLSRLVALA